MGTGSEPPQMPNSRKNVAGSVPVPFFHGRLGRDRRGRQQARKQQHRVCFHRLTPDTLAAQDQREDVGLHVSSPRQYSRSATATHLSQSRDRWSRTDMVANRLGRGGELHGLLWGLDLGATTGRGFVSTGQELKRLLGRAELAADQVAGAGA